ncbi:hypothetical protein [Vallicoccus soli]|uniref:Uncharacterized protein n=1 Tax=Vallicoccus soli TaxID=2339232 RepID=A0A3A3Z2P2_9ACTN|nr:hypothetical protein [Vallicoccus soli]RJK97652.1 hypothetical protein D5H78_01125 [Vallicoccus soli]
MTNSSDNHGLAQAVHDLGAALWFGGSVMGVAGVNKSGQDLTSGIDRIRVASSAWQRFAPAQWGGIAATALAGLRLSATNKGRLAAQEGFRRTGAAKVAVTVLGAGATAYAAYSGMQIGKLAEAAHARGENVDTKDATLPSPATPPEIAAWQQRQRVAQALVPVLSGANIVLTSYLVQAYRPRATLQGLAGKVLPG